MSFRHRSIPVVAAFCAATLALSGCSGDDSQTTDTPTGSGSPTATSAGSVPVGDFDKDAATDVLLTESDLPGYTVVADPAASVGGLDVGSWSVEPAQCVAAVTAATGTLASGADAAKDQVAIRGFEGEQGRVVVEAIAPSDLVPPSAELKQLAQDCHQVTFSSEVQAGGSSSTVSGTATIDMFDVGLGDDSVGLLISAEVSAMGRTIPINAGSAAIWDGDVLISTGVVDLVVGTAGDVPAAVTEIAGKAYLKAGPILD